MKADTKEKNIEEIRNEVGALLESWGTPQKQNNAERIRGERIELVIRVYNLISGDTIKDYNEDIQDYYKKSLHNPDLALLLKTKLMNSYLAPRHDLIKRLKHLNKSERDITKISKWYGRNFGQDNGWIYINKAHLQENK